ncbi:MAG: heme exporter protein C [Psychromonas sp.]
MLLGALILMRFRNEILTRESHRPWVRQLALNNVKIMGKN